MKKTVIYGAGNQAQLIQYYLTYYNLSEVVAFTISNDYRAEESLLGIPVVPYENIVQEFPPDEYELFVALGAQKMNDVRENVYLDGKAKGYRFSNCICPKSTILFPDLIVGENIFIGPGCGIDPFVKIGNNVTIIDTKIGHHCNIGNNILIASSIIGAKSIIEDNCFIGLRSAITPNHRIGHHSFIGVGSIISKDTEPYSVYSPTATAKRNVDSRKLNIV